MPENPSPARLTRRSIHLGAAFLTALATTLVVAALGATTALAAPTTTICHAPGTPGQVTMDVDEAAVQDYLGQGDTLGACAVEPSAADAVVDANALPGEESQSALAPLGTSIVVDKNIITETTIIPDDAVATAAPAVGGGMLPYTGLDEQLLLALGLTFLALGAGMYRSAGRRARPTTH